MGQKVRMASVGTIAFSGSILSLGCFLLRSVPKLLKKLISPVLVRPSPSASPYPSVNESCWVAWVTGGDERGSTGREVGTIIHSSRTSFVSLCIGEGRSASCGSLADDFKDKLAAVGMFVVIGYDAGSVQALHIIKSLAHALSIYVDILLHPHIFHVWVIVHNFHSLVLAAPLVTLFLGFLLVMTIVLTLIHSPLILSRLLLRVHIGGGGGG